MTIEDIIRRDQQSILASVSGLEASFSSQSLPSIASFSPLYLALKSYLKKENDVFYTVLDAGRRIPDRTLLHDLRNDQAGMLFALDNLRLRLEKSKSAAEWIQKWTTLTEVLKKHFDNTTKLFTLSQKILTPQDRQTIDRLWNQP